MQWNATLSLLSHAFLMEVSLHAKWINFVVEWKTFTFNVELNMRLTYVCILLIEKQPNIDWIELDWIGPIKFRIINSAVYDSKHIRKNWYWSLSKPYDC